MQLSCEQEQLSTALDAVLPAVESGPVGVLLDANDHLDVRAANREISIQYQVRGAQVVKEGQIMLLGGVVTDLVNLFPSEQVVMKLDGNGDDDEDNGGTRSERYDAAFQCARHHAHVRAWIPNTVITLPPSDTPIARMEAKVLRDAIRRVAYAAVSPVGRHHRAAPSSAQRLNAVEVEFSEEHVILTGADGYRLARCRAPLVEQIAEEPEVLTIPVDEIRVLRDLLDEGEVSIALDENRRNVIFQTANVVVSIRLGDELPDYQNAIPDKANVRVGVEKEALRRACRTAAALTNHKALTLKLVPGSDSDGDAIIAEARGDGKAEGHGHVKLKGEIETSLEDGVAEIKVAVNVQYLDEAVRTMGSSEVALNTQVGTAEEDGCYMVNSPVAVRPMGGVETQVGVIMPMMADGVTR